MPWNRDVDGFFLAPSRMTVLVVTLLAEVEAGTDPGRPRDNLAAIGQGRYAGVTLDGFGRCVDQHIDRRGCMAVLVITLLIDAVFAAVLTVRRPSDDPSAIRQGLNGGSALLAGGFHIHQDSGRGRWDSRWVEALLVNVAAGALRMVGDPCDHPSAIGQSRDLLLRLIRGIRDPDQLIALARCASIAIVALLVNIILRLIEERPGHDPAAIRQSTHGGVQVEAARRVDPCMRADCVD